MFLPLLIPLSFDKHFPFLLLQVSSFYPIQGSAADIIKLAMIKVDQLLKENHMKSKMILQVHDELIFDVYQDELDKMMKLVKEGMESAYQMKVELKAADP